MRLAILVLLCTCVVTYAAAYPSFSFHAKGEEDIGKTIGGRLIRPEDRPRVSFELVSVNPATKEFEVRNLEICFRNTEHLWQGYIQLYYSHRQEQIEVPLCTTDDPKPRCWEQKVCAPDDPACLHPSFPCIRVASRHYTWSSLRHVITDGDVPAAQIISRDERIVIPLAKNL